MARRETAREQQAGHRILQEGWPLHGNRISSRRDRPATKMAVYNRERRVWEPVWYQIRTPKGLSAILRKTEESQDSSSSDSRKHRKRMVVWTNGDGEEHEVMAGLPQSLYEAEQQVVGRIRGPGSRSNRRMVPAERMHSVRFKDLERQVPLQRANKEWHAAWNPAAEAHRDFELYNRGVLSQGSGYRTSQETIQSDSFSEDSVSE